MEIKANKIHKAYKEHVVLEDISFILSRGQKIGLVGYNGTGKSTLLKILAGELDYDGGTLGKRKDLIVGYMPQDTSEELSKEGDVLQFLREKTKNNHLEEYKIEITFAGLGLENISLNANLQDLSSGQKSKIFLAGILLLEPDVMLLDEPTNNLDLTALIWLERFLKKSSSACIIVSHDRLFLDRMVNKIFEIEWNSRILRIINGKYSDYIKQKEKEFQRQLQKHWEEQKEIDRLDSFVKKKQQATIKGSAWKGTDNDKYLRGFKRDRASASGKIVKTTKKRIEKALSRLTQKPLSRDVYRILISPIKPVGESDILFENVVLGYSGGFKTNQINFRFSYGNRIVILGENGTGKSTILKAISGRLKPIEGIVKIGNSLIVGNLMQEHDDLPWEKTLIEYISERTKLSLQNSYALLNKFAFSQDDANKKIASFSPGSRSRILLALFSKLSVNILLLDEPTNHLDLEALTALENVLLDYPGTIILVSHDRYFIKKYKADYFYLMQNGKLSTLSDFDKYLQEVKNNTKRLKYIL